MGGQLLGSLLPAPANKILHPVIVTCLAINGAAAAFGAATGIGYEPALGSYITKVMRACPRAPFSIVTLQLSFLALKICYQMQPEMHAT